MPVTTPPINLENSATNAEGRTALHIALSYNDWCNKAPFTITPDYIRELYNDYPAAARMKDRSGQTPLHLAASNNPSLVPVLLELEPRAGFMQDNFGKLPETYEKGTEAQKLLDQYSTINFILGAVLFLGTMAIGIIVLSSLLSLSALKDKYELEREKSRMLFPCGHITLSAYQAKKNFDMVAIIVMSVPLLAGGYLASKAGDITEYCADYFTMLVAKPKASEEQSPGLV